MFVTVRHPYLSYTRTSVSPLTKSSSSCCLGMSFVNPVQPRDMRTVRTGEAHSHKAVNITASES